MIEIADKVYWTGKIADEMKKFHGEELSTHNGSSFNSYFIDDDKKVLIDSVWIPYSDEFIQNLKNKIDLNKIDYIISTHGEPDHSGSLPKLLELIPDTPVICSANGQKSLEGYYHKSWNFKVVKTGDTLDTGKHRITFIEAPMLHWPDTMMCHLSEKNILFSSDVFGQHYASDKLFADLADTENLEYETIKYFACIISPFSTKVLRKIEDLKNLHLPIEMICPAHGMIWRENPKDVIDSYFKWADSYKEDQITIVYDTMYESTQKMAEAVSRGIQSANSNMKVKLFNTSKTDRSDLVTEIFRSKALCVGSPAVNNGAMPSIVALLEEIKHMNLTGKAGFSFGSYGWSGPQIEQINKLLSEANFRLSSNGVKTKWNPIEDILILCEEAGKELALSV